MSCISQLRNRISTIIIVVGFIGCLPWVASAGDDPVADIARTFAASSVRDGRAVGVGLGIVVGHQPPRYFSFGLANVTSATPFRPDTVFEIGSVTKVFTTNLLGQQIDGGRLSLADPLSAFGPQLGSFLPLPSTTTLMELGDFTAGLPSLAPLCRSAPTVPGCLPSNRPTPNVYTAQDFLRFFQNAVPYNFQVSPPVAVTSLPAPYNYSDYSIGLVGLLMGGNPNEKLSNQALDGWVSLTNAKLLRPLAMRSTYLNVPPSSQGRTALGYDQAIGTAVVADGRLRGVTLQSAGALYPSVPRVSIVGGGGRGAAATATVNMLQTLTGFTVTSGGSGYVAAPTVTFAPTAGVSNSGTPATAEAIVCDGKITGIKILSDGSGYTQAPTVSIAGGRRDGVGRDARAVAHIGSGHVTFVAMLDGGAGYEDPIAVGVEPGQSFVSAIPIWAPAGALHSTIRDMTTFAAAALGHSRIGTMPVNPAITSGFEISETPYACSGPIPNLATCQISTGLSGLAWNILPGDKINRFPATVSKNGALPGYATQLTLMPARDLAVVVFVNSNSTSDTDSSVAESQVIARNILHALYYEDVGLATLP